MREIRLLKDANETVEQILRFGKLLPSLITYYSFRTDCSDELNMKQDDKAQYHNRSVKPI